MNTRTVLWIIAAPFVVLSVVDGLFILIGLQAHRRVQRRRRPDIDDLTIREYGYQFFD
jgi:hypothetical protein